MPLRIIPGPLIAAAAALFVSSAVFAAAGPQGSAQAAKIAHSSNCFSCHALDKKIVGPAFGAVAAKFAGQKGAQTTLAAAIKNGHVGTWGNVPMPPHPELSQAQADQLAAWILSLKPQTAAASAAPARKYTYTADGKQVTTPFPVFKSGTQKVTASLFRGYELYNSYCFRCHGEDATGSEYAPDLRRSLNNGMSEEQFLTISMEGRKAKGMPSWAGFFSPHDIHVIYEYVDARALGLVPVGTPSE
jgi:cytochrome c